VKLGKKLTPQRLCPTHELLIAELVQQVLHQPSKGVRIKKIPGESAYKKTRSKAHERNSKPLTPEEWERLRLDFKNFYNPVGSSEEARARNKRRYFRQHLFYRLKNKGGILPAGTTFSEFAHLKVDDSTPPDEALAQVEAVTARLNGAVTKSDGFERQTAAKPTSSSPTEIDVQNPSEYSEKISIPHQREASRKSKVDIREGLKRFQEVKESGILPAGITFGEFARLNIDNGTTADEVLAGWKQSGPVRMKLSRNRMILNVRQPLTPRELE
jgi:hypothetical protein